ncbi:MAG: glycosyltransferase, partial [Kordiimonadaceae bacterium]|nr:glycosyltransferase [Kordiimonadaceae bacterium]
MENRLRHLIAGSSITATVVAPVPWFPFKGRWFGAYGRAAEAPRQEERHGITIYHPRYLVIPKIGMLLTPYFLFRSALKSVQRLITKGQDFDLIDAHYLYPDGVAASKLARALGKPFVMTARGSDVTEIALLERPRMEILAAISGASHTICVSENLRRDLIGLGAEPKQITTLRNGVDLVRFHIQQLDTLKYAGTPKKNRQWTLVFAGWLIPRKRLDLVLEVTRQIPELKTIIVGDGPLRNALEARAQKIGIADRVEFLGQKKPEEMA